MLLVVFRGGRFTVGLEDLGDLEWVDVDVERMCFVVGLVHHRPPFGRAA